MTIKDIARKAGVSVATVSRVINNSGYVSEEKKELIRRIIEENNYYPNAAARNLTGGTLNAIGLIMPERINPFFMKIYDGVAAKAEEEGLMVLFFSTEDNEAKQTEVISYLKAQRIKGLLITPSIYHTQETAKSLQKLEEAGIPVVLIDRNLEEGDFDAVLIDNKSAIYSATEELINAGHRKIAVINCPESEKKGSCKLDGYRECMKKYKLPSDDELIYKGGFNIESGYEACRYFMGLSEDKRPTAVIAFSSSELTGAMKYFNETGRKIGEDIVLTGFDDIGTVPEMGFDIKVINRPMRIMGEKAFELLTDRIKNKNRKLKEIILSTRTDLHERRRELWGGRDKTDMI